MIRNSTICLALLAALCTFYPLFASAQSCGGYSATANLVIMIDRSLSSDAVSLASEKAATLSLIAKFEQAQVKPLIAVGTYNTACIAGAGCANAASLVQARIIAPLSTNYDVARSAVSGLQGPGTGGTNAAQAINVAKTEILQRGQAGYSANIILISDGHPNFPGYVDGLPTCPAGFTLLDFPGYGRYCAVLYNGTCPTGSSPWYQYCLATPTPSTCVNCNCPQAENAGMAAADVAQSGGVRVFTVATTSTTCANPDLLYLRNDIASSPTDAFPNTLSMIGVFDLIAQQITCDNTNACLVKSCNSGTCQVMHNYSGQPCVPPAGSPCNTGVYSCPTNTNLVCVPQCSTPTPIPTPVPTSSVNSACTTTNIAGYQTSLNTVTKSQNGQLVRLYNDLEMRKTSCINRKEIQSFLRKNRPASTKSLAVEASQAAGLPSTTLSCPASAGCSSAAVNINSVVYSTNSANILSITNQAAKLWYTCRTNAGRCEGSAAACRERTLLRRRQYNSELSLAKTLNTQNLSTLKAIPSTTAVCPK